MTENKKRINVYIPMETYVKVTQSGESLTEAIINSLDLYLSGNKPEIESNQASSSEAEVSLSQEILNLQEARFEDLRLQIQTLNRQLVIKDDQIHKKDEQIEKQAFHIQTLLTQKAIEVPGTKKPWWQIWR
jgi:uncharacterized protein (DUF3084 family)